ncbi:MAG: mechanosensitive ion channel [Candidatus Promineifilaceae bacterium]|nr:mechanosensitive ion channel [Candidatus Promineifilaceae bacterium]
MDEVQSLTVTLEEIQRQFLLFLPKLIAAIVVFIVGLYVASLVSKLVDRALKRRDLGAEGRMVVTQLVRWSLIVLAVVTALEQVNFDLTAFVAGLGIAGFTIGFALKDISENFVAGLLLLLQRPFELGDVVKIDDFRGRITDVSLRATEMITMDGHNVLLPNSLVYTSPIYNYTRSRLARIAVDVGVAYDSDLDKVRETALEAISALPDVLDDPEPSVTFHTFADSSINLTLFYWVDNRETRQFQAADLAVPVIKSAFERQGIDIPFPIRTVYMDQS